MTDFQNSMQIQTFVHLRMNYYCCCSVSGSVFTHSTSVEERSKVHFDECISINLYVSMFEFGNVRPRLKEPILDFKQQQ